MDNKQKIKLLVLNVSNAGVGKFRFRDPHKLLQKNYKDEFHIDIVTNPPLHDKKYYENFDAIFAQGSLLIKDDVFAILQTLKKDGLKIILDLDDYWRLPRTHAMFVRMENSWKILTSRLKIADMVTTTTKFLAAKIKRYNKNVAILPNAINPKDKQFQPNPIESERVRIGWVGGSSHLEDLKLLRGVFNKLQRIDTPNQMVMCGFNNQSRDIKTGKVTEVEFPKVWMQCEHVFTGGYNLDESYRHFLLRPRKEEYSNVDNEPYRRVWTKDISTYGTCYNQIDIALAPLVDNEFNEMKSQLKVIEAGFHKKPLIVTDIAPYQIDCIHEKNSLMVTDRKAHKNWFKFIKRLAENPNMREDLGEALYDTVKVKYNLNTVCEKRRQVYQSLF